MSKQGMLFSKEGYICKWEYFISQQDISFPDGNMSTQTENNYIPTNTIIYDRGNQSNARATFGQLAHDWFTVA